MAGRIEEIILNQLVQNRVFFDAFISHIKPDYFSDDDEKVLFGLIHEHAIKYDQQATCQVLLNEIQGTNLGQDRFDLLTEYVNEVIDSDTHTPPTQKWLDDKSDDWCESRSLENAIWQSVHVFQGDDTTVSRDGIPDLIRDALAVSRNPDIGHSFFDDVEKRWDRLHDQVIKIPFDIELLNMITKGGLEPKTLNCLIAETGTGKTIFLCHVAAGAIRQGYNVSYITAEMDEWKIAERIDANLLGISMDEVAALKKKDFTGIWKQNISRYSLESKSYGRLFIKQYPTATAHVGHFRSFHSELALKKQFKPHMIIIDYLNICASSRISMGSNVGLYAYIKSIAEEFRGFAVEMDVPILTATQVNRQGMDSTDFGMNATSESVGLPHTLDLFLAMINCGDKCIFKQLKNRYGSMHWPSQRFYIGLDAPKMKFYDMDDWKVNLEEKGKKKGKKAPPGEDDVILFDKSTDDGLLGIFDSEPKPETYGGIEI
jgi:archaellum biogenesis ATPase FlaH